MSLSTREKQVRSAYELFCKFGVHAAGLDQIIKKAGVTKGTFYNHFESKDALILAVLEWRDASWPDNLRDTLRKHAGENPCDQLLAFVEFLDEIRGTEKYHGCLFLRAAAEFPMLHDPIHIVVHQFVGAVGTALRELASYAGAKDPDTLARELLVVIAGAYANSQMGDPCKAVETGKRLAKRILTEALKPTRTNAKAKKSDGKKKTR
jgi:AcrR family transcriptional regulator